ncbi:protein regulator of cytokinesis 1 isoform X3 [Xenopus laevis]|uniref:Protein regulator of cytokinesis 1 isoform X3 n=1 Tax=Xenopus laevis TaxID=8355 RepID=A0A8J0UJL5_XENLA|nr:protein regulator of cytokinesis 1 isoform X3 [Xenopus laevis]
MLNRQTIYKGRNISDVSTTFNCAAFLLVQQHRVTVPGRSRLRGKTSICRALLFSLRPIRGGVETVEPNLKTRWIARFLVLVFCLFARTSSCIDRTMPRGTRKSEVLAASLISSMNHALSRLMDIWDGLGIKEEMRMRRMEEVKKHIEELFNRMISEEVDMKDRIEKSIQNCKKELKVLCHELSIEEYMVDEGMTVLQTERDLRVRLELLLTEKNERLEELRLLQQKDIELCTDLCVTPYYIPTGSIPSRQQLEELKEHIKVYTEEKKQRLQIFSTLRAEIRQCLDEMGRQPENSLEQDAICEDEEAFFLTADNIKALRVLKEQLELKKETMLSNLSAIKERVQVLWSRLQVPQDEQETCQKSSLCSIADSIKLWENELQHLEDLKKANLKDVVLKIRDELKMYWDKCLYTTEQRNAFTPYYNDDFTEDLLSQHDEEVVRMRLQYEKCKEMLDAVNKWETSWGQFVLLELEEELKSRIEAWETEQGCAFLLKGCKFMDYVTSQWEMHKKQKEREKQDRSLKKEEHTPFKTPVKRPAGSCIQGTPSNKTRKLNGTSNSVMSRTTVSNSSTSTSSQSLNGKMPLSTIKTPMKTRDTPGRTPLQDSNKQSSGLSSQPSSYSEFKEEMTKKSSNSDAIFNSTILYCLEFHPETWLT